MCTVWNCSHIDQHLGCYWIHFPIIGGNWRHKLHWYVSHKNAILHYYCEILKIGNWNSFSPLKIKTTFPPWKITMIKQQCACLWHNFIIWNKMPILCSNTNKIVPFIVKKLFFSALTSLLLLLSKDFFFHLSHFFCLQKEIFTKMKTIVNLDVKHNSRKTDGYNS